MNDHQDYGTEWVHTLWPMIFCPEEGANLFSLMCKLLQENNVSSGHWNNIVVESSEGNFVLDH